MNRIVIMMLASALVACCLVGPIWWPVSAWGQQSPGTGQTAAPAQQKPPLFAELAAYKQQAYLVLGPMTLTQYDGKTLTVYQDSGDIAIDLRGKKFTVKDGDAKPTSVNAIKLGRKVYVAAGEDEVVLYVPERKKGATDVAH
jgi:predicted small lipoprotein YifL